MYYTDIDSFKLFVPLINKKRHLNFRFLFGLKFAIFFILPNFKPKEYLTFVNNLRIYNLLFIKKPSFCGYFIPKLSFVAYAKTSQNLLWYVDKLSFSQGNRMVIPFLQLDKNLCAYSFVKKHLNISSLVHSQNLLLKFLFFLSYNSIILFKNANIPTIIKVLKKKKNTYK